jgi:hypothetical protein
MLDIIVAHQLQNGSYMNVCTHNLYGRDKMYLTV